MVTKGTKSTAKEAAKSAASAMTAPPEKEEAGPVKITAVRLSEKEHKKIKSFFVDKGIPISSGFKIAADYVMELSRSGAITISKAGIIDRRG
ncbi:hypothetical protein FACS189479_04900 [Spirochaetia bacterium]|nr:hypothetical protein FACS189479_04900 [Spirochaetia bacterium]